MKVVLFCGGQGMRMRDYSDVMPKPMVQIGYRPILWHLMKYYAHYGHKEFILCLGHRADYIKEYFLNYQEAASNDFVLKQGGTALAPTAHAAKVSADSTVQSPDRASPAACPAGRHPRWVRPEQKAILVLAGPYMGGLQSRQAA